ncbi:MAG: hypothetical protein WC862_05665, partial [Patescibacteria group bacterium]
SVAQGALGCYIEKKIILPADIDLDSFVESDNVDESTVVIPADTSLAQPIFLTDRQSFRCEERFKGCQQIALEDHYLPMDANPIAYQHQAAFLLNDPEKYEDTLCRNDLVGCERYASGNNISYFKNPELTGDKFCVYQEGGADNSGVTRSGWFKEGVGKCQRYPNVSCQSSEDCRKISNNSEDVCIDNGLAACYSDYLEIGGAYGIWSNASAGGKYQGFVGRCDSSYNSCTELLDPADTSDLHPDGEPYYVIFDNEINKRIGDCGGKASLQAGCVLFDNINNPNKLFDSRATYKLSEAEARKQGAAVDKGSMVSPVAAGDLDSNIILNVDRDRQCNKWLACRSSEAEKHESTGADVFLCSDYNLCEQTSAGLECAKWVDDLDELELFLTEEKYINRGVSWNDEEYSGYSLFNKYQIGSLAYFSPDFGNFSDLQVEFGNTKYLAHEVDKRVFERPEFENFGCAQKQEWDGCGFDNGGRCLGERCFYPIDGKFMPLRADYSSTNDTHKKENIRAVLTALIYGSCKQHPEQDSPYAADVVLNKSWIPAAQSGEDPFNINIGTSDNPNNARRRTDFKETNPLFRGANLCQTVDGKDVDCSCSYKKVIYKNGAIDYWPSSVAAGIPPGICVGGSKEGSPCVDNEGCSDDSDANSGLCNLENKRETHIGLTGFCLEPDLSRPLLAGKDPYACLTWLPIDVSADNIASRDWDTKAGYDPSVDAVNTAGGADKIAGQTYCTDSNSASGGQYEGDMFIDLDSDSSDAGHLSTSRGTFGNFKDNYARTYPVTEIRGNPLRLSYNITPFQFIYTYPEINDSVGHNLRYPSEINLTAEEATIDFQKAIYSAVQLWLWHELQVPNAIVLQVRNPYYWGQFHEQAYHGQHMDGSLGLYRNLYLYDDADPDGGREVVDYFLNEDIEEQSISKIYFTPFIIPSDVDVFFICDDIVCGRPRDINSRMRTWILDDVFVDFEALEKNNCGQAGDIYDIKKCDIEGAPASGQGSNIVVYPRDLNKPLFGGGEGQQIKLYTFKCNRGAQQNRYGFYLAMDSRANNKAEKAVELLCANGKISEAAETDRALFNLQDSYITFTFTTFDGRLQYQTMSRGFSGELEEHTDSTSYFTELANNNSVFLAAAVELKSQCTEFSLVYDNSRWPLQPEKPSNKAFTNKVWQYSNYKLLDNTLLAGTPLRPFGSTYLSADFFKNSDEFLRNYAFDDINQDGLPYACKSFGFPRGDKYAEASIDGSGCVGLPDGEEFGYAEFKDKL